MGRGLELPSGRVIALGRLMLAALFLFTIWLDESQPAYAPAEVYALLTAYLAFAAAISLLTWKNWWLDARLAGPAHVIDIGLFTLLVLSTEGYTSPYFTFFAFVLLAAAIRWGWRVTALTAVLLTLLYVTAGLLALTSVSFDPMRFVIRTGHLVILSLILIWFGINQWRARFDLPAEELLDTALDEPPLDSALRAAMAATRASEGAMIWRQHGEKDCTAISLRGGQFEAKSSAEPKVVARIRRPLLYDIGRGRALARNRSRDHDYLVAREVIDGETIALLGLGEGLALPVASEDGAGVLFLEKVKRLSSDHLDFGEQVAAAIAAHIQRHALLKAAEESAEARSRLGLARDLHDSVVQFLAGAAFRIEAMKRSEASGRGIEPELDELKQLMLQEQGELRSFISALRSGPQVALAELAEDLRQLVGRLARQWDIECRFTVREAEMMVPTRLHLDAHQLVREAVANAVRHGAAKQVQVCLEAVGQRLRIDVLNDVQATQDSGFEGLPRSLKERVEQAGGSLDMARGMDVTKVTIELPIPRGMA